MSNDIQQSRSLGRAGLALAGMDLLEMTEAQCWERLASEHIGRIAIVVEGIPRVFPVNHAVLPGLVIFRTGPGTKLTYGPGSIACYEVDGFSLQTFEGWSVMVVGRLAEADPDAYPELETVIIKPDAPGPKLHGLVLTADEISGRYFRTGWRL